MKWRRPLPEITILDSKKYLERNGIWYEVSLQEVPRGLRSLIDHSNHFWLEGKWWEIVKKLQVNSKLQRKLNEIKEKLERDRGGR